MFFALYYMHTNLKLNMNVTPSFLSVTAYRLYVAGLFLLPIGVAASVYVPFLPLKVLIGTVTLGGALILGIFASLKRGGLSLPINPMILTIWLLPIAYALSTLVSPSWMQSLVGNQLDVDTVFFVGLLALAVSLPVYLFSARTDFARAFFALIASAWIMAIFHIVRLFFGADVLSLGVYTNQLFSLIGKWNDMAIFFGLVSLLSLITLEALSLSRIQKLILGATLAVSLFLVAVVNFMAVWVVLGIIALGIVLYRAVLGGGHVRFSVAPTIVFVLAVVCIIFSSTIGSSLGTYFGTVQIEARPSFQSTLSVAQQVLHSSPFLGSGPNTFILNWDLYRPIELNQTVFWNVDFTSGVGFVPTSVVTVGFIGLLAWVLFFGAFLWMGVRALLITPPTDPFAYHLVLGSFVGALYLMVMAVVYLPSPPLLIIGFAIAGMFAALYHQEQGGRTFSLIFAERPRIGFVAVLGLTLVLVATVAVGYGVGSVFASNVYYERASYAAQVEGDVASATVNLSKAANLSLQDRYFRFGTLIQLNKLSQILNTTQTDATNEQLQNDFRVALGSAVENGLAATRINQSDYRNWQVLGNAYQSVVVLNIDGAYESAKTAYARARALNPGMPTIPLASAQLELARTNNKDARLLVEEALRLKEDYIPALLLLAQIELNAGNLAEAIKRAESAAIFEPSNPVTRFQVGILKFENKDIKGAVESFAAAVKLESTYANARFYYGRALLAQGKRTEALSQFAEVQKLNPDNTEIRAIIDTITDGGNPFAPVPVPKK